MKYWPLLFLFFISSQSFAQDSTLFNQVIRQLNLDPFNIDTEFMVAKVRPENPKETIVVIPEIAEEDGDYITFNCYLLIVNSETRKIVNRYFEPSCWYSDAIVLSGIEIDTAPYKVSENNRAFGIRVHYYGRSQPNPYSHSSLSLFVKSKDRLERILKNYEVIDYGGEWDMQCDGESIGEKKTLIMRTNKTNAHFDILVKNEITETETHADENGECLSTEKITTLKSTLKFNGEEYTENGAFRPLDVFLTDPDEKLTNIRQEPNGKVILKIDDEKDYYTLTITEAKDGWFKLVTVEGVDYGNVDIPGGKGWIHHSLVGAGTRRNIKLLDAPEGELVVGTIEQEIGVQIKDKYKDWVQIEYNGLTGWVESMWLCGNPVTTCP